MREKTLLLFSLLLWFSLTGHLVAAAQMPIDSLKTPEFSKVNTKYDEKYPILSADGQQLYFVRKFDPQNTGGASDPGDIWVSQKDSLGQWGAPQNFEKPANSSKEDRVVGVSVFANVLWLYGYYDQRSVTYNKPALFKYSKNNRVTKVKRQNIKFFNNLAKKEDFFVSKDGQILLMAIKSFDTYGSHDIYVSFKKKESGYDWTLPKNIGKQVNTEFQEMSPFLADDQKTLFFATNGRHGNGSMDNFVCQRLDDTWTNWSHPVNLGERVNSNAKDRHLVFFPPDYGVYSTNSNSMGYGDLRKAIWSADSLAIISHLKSDSINTKIAAIQKTNSNERVISGYIFDKTTKKALSGVQVTIVLDKGLANKMTTVETGSDGLYSFKFSISKVKKVRIRIDKKQYFPIEADISLSDFDEGSKRQNFHIEKLEKGVTIRLSRVLFKTGTDELLAESFPQLELMYKVLKDNDKLMIELRGHTDGVGKGDANLILSQKRVERVKSILMKKGIKRKRIIGKGYGGSMPLADNRLEQGRKKNRRVEFKILNN